MSDSITDLRPFRGIKLHKKRFQISVTRSDFQGALTAITRDLSDEQEEVNYGINFYDQTGDDFGIIKWWRSKLDPERFHETLIVGFSHIARGPMLLQVEAQIPQRIGLRTAEEETAWRILRELGSRFPECGLDKPPATLEIPKSDDATPDQAGEPPRPGRRDVEDNVRRAHELLKDGKTTPTAVFRQARTDKRTYLRYCEGVTGEKPLV